jgi:CRISPR-associated protein Csb1
MNIDLTPLANEQKLLFQVSLKPIQGHRFQPTGFPDLGAATFQIPSGQALLVESAQSMANRLEGVCWNDAENQPVSCLSGISYVRVERDGEYLTSSIREAHRVNSPYILESKDKTFYTKFKSEVDALKDGPINRQFFTKTLLKYDIGSLIHGVFVSKSDLAGGRLRLERALSSFIEAEHAQVAASGGVKNDHVNPSGSTKEGFGNVPFHRDEYTSEKITCYINLDLGQIRGYGLGDDATHLLILLSLYKIQALLDGDLRLRTACDFQVVDDIVTATRPAGFSLPSLADLQSDLPEAIKACAGDMGQTTVQFKS